MNDGWNFHGHIAVPLETYQKEIIGKAIYSADEIVSGKFVDAMVQTLSILFSETGYYQNFAEKCDDYVGKPLKEIGKEKTIELFSEFQDLYGRREK